MNFYLAKLKAQETYLKILVLVAELTEKHHSIIGLDNKNFSTIHNEEYTSIKNGYQLSE